MADKVLSDGLILTDWADQMAKNDDHQFQQFQRKAAIDDYQKQQAISAAQQQAFQQQAAGNTAQAMQTAAAGNAQDYWNSLHDSQKAAALAQAGDIHNAAYTLSQTAPGQARQDVINSFVPTLKAHGATDQDIAGLRANADNNDFLNGHINQAIGVQQLWQNDNAVKKAAQDHQYKVDEELSKPITIDHDLVDPRTGQLIYRAAKQEIVGKDASVYSGDTVEGVPGSGYDTVVGNGKFGAPSTPLSSMSIGNVISYGKNTLIPNTRNNAALGLAGTGMGSSASGRYQITGQTLQNYAPRVLGQGWQNQPFDAAAQDKIGEAIFNDNKGGNLSKVWTSLTPAMAAQVSKMPWSQAKEIIAQGESGGSSQVRTPGKVVYSAPASSSDDDDTNVDYTKRFAGPALDQMAQQYATTGHPPQIGTGKDASKIKLAVIQRAAQLYPNANIASNAANYHADQGALNQQRKLQAGMDMNDDTINQNLNIMDKYYNKSYGHTGIPLLNRVLQSGAQAAGDGDTSAYKTAQDIVLTEVAKVMTSPTGGGTLSDSARHEVNGYLYPGASPDQMRKGIALLKQDVANRRNATDGSIRNIQNRMGGQNQPQAATRTVNGRTYTKVDGGWRAI